MKKTPHPEPRQLSLNLDAPAEGVHTAPFRSARSATVLNFPRRSPTTAFQEAVIESLVRTRVIVK